MSDINISYGAHGIANREDTDQTNSLGGTIAFKLPSMSTYGPNVSLHRQ